MTHQHEEHNPEDMDEIVTVTMPRGEYVMLRKLLANLNAASMMMRWWTMAIIALATVSGIIYSIANVFPGRAGGPNVPGHG